MSKMNRKWVAVFLALSGLGAAVLQAQAAPAPEPRPLEPGQPIERELAGGDTHLYRVALERGDFLAVSVLQKGIDLMVNVLGPDGAKVQEVDSPNGANGLEPVALLAKATGAYTVEIKALEAGVAAGRYEIKLEELVKPAERIGYRQPLLSHRLIALRDRLAAGDPAALDRFWQEVVAQGTPLLEPFSEDPERILVTFLWRAQPDTVNAYVSCGWDHFEDSRMDRLPGTDVYYKSYPLRSDARFTYSLSINDSEVPLRLVNWDNPREGDKRTITFQPDPLNSHRFPDEPGIPDAFVSSVVELPKAPPQIWRQPRPDVASGKLAREIFKSEILGNARLVQVYTPPDYRADGEPYDLLILFGGRAYSVEIPTPVILDNLLAAKRIRPTVAVMVASPGLAARDVELACAPRFNDFLITELFPWIRKNYHVTSDPRRTTVGGFSFGGLAAAFAGLRHPEVFGNVLSQSGSFWWKPKDDTEPEWLTRQFAAASRVPVRLYLEVGLLESVPKTNDLGMLMVNRHLRDVLTAKGYEVIYSEFSGDHESTSWRGTLADALQVLLGVQQPEVGKVSP